MEKIYSEYDKYKYPFEERIIEVVRGKRDNPYNYLKPFTEIYELEEPFCVQYNSKQRPISSYGVALYNMALGEWLVVEPKYTIEFLSLLKGSYTVSQLPFYIDQLHDSELELILEDPDPSSLQDSPAKRIYHKIHDIVFYTNVVHVLYESMWIDNYQIISSIAMNVVEKRRSSSETCLQTVFPKGRSSGKESWAETALREFSEETGINIMFDNPATATERLNCKYMEDLTNVWEPCRVFLNNRSIDGYMSRVHISHTHCASGGKLYKTVVWICVVSLTREESQSHVIKDNSETRAALWLDGDEMRKKFRVQDLYTKCEYTLNKYFPYLSF